MSDSKHAGAGDQYFPGDGEMAGRMRAYPWADSPVGEPEHWPAGLRASMWICLTCRFPVIILWGEQMLMLYNDAYRVLIGAKHPTLMREVEQVWGEVWPTIGPQLDSVLSTGQTAWSKDQALAMNRHGYWEETYWTYSYSPLRNDDGTVGGVFTALQETTEEVVGQRRISTLQDLGAQAGQSHSVDEACTLVVQALSRASGVIPFAAIYLRDSVGRAVLSRSTAPVGSLSRKQGSPGTWPADEVLRGGRAVTVTDLASRFGKLPDGGWLSPPSEAMVLPLSAGTDEQPPVGAIVLAASGGRPLDEGYQTFFGLVAQQTAALVNGAVAYQAQLRKAEELADLDRAKTAFFSNVSHEFRTPLTLIMGPVEELRAGLDDADSGTAQMLDMIYRNGLRLGKLVNALLDFARIEAGRVQASFEPSDLGAFTTELASVFQSAFKQAGLRYDVDCPSLSEPVYIDHEMWEKVVFNLLSNALKFTFTGSVSIRLGEEQGQAVLRVSDTGTGIAADEIPRLFDRFHRVEHAPSRSHEGSGIGLALVRELVGLHGGTITADSTESAGTTFTVRIPFGHEHLPDEAVHPVGSAHSVSTTADSFLAEAMAWLPGTRGADHDRPGVEAATAAADVAHRDADGKSPRASVLLADDDADMCEYVERLLRPGYLVTTVTDGQAALEAASASPPDIIISDVMMPGLGGLDLVAALRANPRTAGVPVLLLSARHGEEASVAGLEAGADDYLVKPFAAADLLARVRANLELSRARNQHAHWRAALLDALQEAVFLLDEDGDIVEVNAAFTAILGYGPEGLPYRTRPWWPDEQTDPEGHQLARESLIRLMANKKGGFSVPMRCSDGRRIWASGTFNEVVEPETGRRMVVGTFRDITAEHDAIQRDSALAAMALVLSHAESVAEVLREALGQIRRLWQAQEVTAATWSDTDQAAVMSTGSVDSWERLSEGAREGLEALRHQPVLTPMTAWPAGVGIRLEHPAGVLGIWIELGSGRVLTVDDRTLLRLIGGYLAQALHRWHQTDQHREAAITLQRAILGPARLPDGFAARYEPASRPLEVGGDWYDIIELPDGRIGIVVGDCVGHDLGAATGMGQLRSACRALLLQDPSASRTLIAADTFASFVPSAEYATVFCGILDPETGELTYSSAAHPPGIVVPPDGRPADLLEGGRSLPLAVPHEERRAEAVYTLPSRSTLLLYTDGLVERRGRELTHGIGIAGTAIREAGDLPLEDLATRVMSELAPPTGYDDDVAVVLYRHPGPLDVTFPAEPGQLAPVRTKLRQWLKRSGVTGQAAQNVLVAAGEAVTNAIEHGHRDAPGEPVRLRAVSAPGQLRLTVTDSGSWQPSPPEEHWLRGQGIGLMRALTEHVTISPDPSGTVVDIHVRIGNGNSA